MPPIARRRPISRASAGSCSPYTTVDVRPGEVGYNRAPLAYAWNELREMLGVESPARVVADGTADEAARRITACW